MSVILEKKKKKESSKQSYFDQVSWVTQGRGGAEAWCSQWGDFARCVCVSREMIALSLHKRNAFRQRGPRVEQLPPRARLDGCHLVHVPQFGWAGYEYGFTVQRPKQQLIVYSPWPAKRRMDF